MTTDSSDVYGLREAVAFLKIHDPNVKNARKKILEEIVYMRKHTIQSTRMLGCYISRDEGGFYIWVDPGLWYK
jgi:hypothetical protein